MVPLSGLRVGGTAVPSTARGAILHSGSALSLLTAKDFLYLGAVSFQQSAYFRHYRLLFRHCQQLPASTWQRAPIICVSFGHNFEHPMQRLPWQVNLGW